MGCDAPLGVDDHCGESCESCEYWDGKYDDDEDDEDFLGEKGGKK
jgi:hypothetical protein